jgi:integrase
VRNPYTATYRRRNGKVYTEERRFPLQQIAYFHVAFYTGARRGELLALTWNDVNWDNRKIDINKAVSVTTKGSKIKPPKSQNGYRVLEMTQQCTEILKEWYDEAKKRSILIDTDWKGYKGKDFDKNNVFITDEGQPMHSTTPYQALKRAVKAYNKNATETKSLPEIRLHDARHTNASLQIALGVSLADTSRNLGHGNVGTTARIYTHGQETSAHTAMKALEDALG